MGRGNSFYRERFENQLQPSKKKMQHFHLQDHDNQMQAIQYENVALQEQTDVYQAQLEKFQDTIIYLTTRYVPHARDHGKGNIIIIVRKHTTPANKYHDLPYYVARIQRRKRYVKLR